MNQLIVFCAVNLIYISILIVVLYVILKHEKKNYVKHLFIIFGSAFFAWLIAHIIKDQVAHARPDLVNALITTFDAYSFPSGHATFMFAFASIIYFFDKKVNMAIVIAVIATITGISRVLAGVHYWYDIVGGAILGVVVSYGVSIIVSKFLK